MTMSGQMFVRSKDSDLEQGMETVIENVNRTDGLRCRAPQAVEKLLGTLTHLEDSQPPTGLVSRTLERVEHARASDRPIV
jgi:hypothetical protein